MDKEQPQSPANPRRQEATLGPIPEPNPAEPTMAQKSQGSSEMLPSSTASVQQAGGEDPNALPTSSSSNPCSELPLLSSSNRSARASTNGSDPTPETETPTMNLSHAPAFAAGYTPHQYPFIPQNHTRVHFNDHITQTAYDPVTGAPYTVHVDFGSAHPQSAYLPPFPQAPLVHFPPSYQFCPPHQPCQTSYQPQNPPPAYFGPASCYLGYPSYPAASHDTGLTPQYINGVLQMNPAGYPVGFNPNDPNLRTSHPYPLPPFGYNPNMGAVQFPPNLHFSNGFGTNFTAINPNLPPTATPSSINFPPNLNYANGFGPSSFSPVIQPSPLEFTSQIEQAQYARGDMRKQGRKAERLKVGLVGSDATNGGYHEGGRRMGDFTGIRGVREELLEEGGEGVWEPRRVRAMDANGGVGEYGNVNGMMMGGRGGMKMGGKGGRGRGGFRGGNHGSGRDENQREDRGREDMNSGFGSGFGAGRSRGQVHSAGPSRGGHSQHQPLSSSSSGPRQDSHYTQSFGRFSNPTTPEPYNQASINLPFGYPDPYGHFAGQPPSAEPRPLNLDSAQEFPPLGTAAASWATLPSPGRIPPHTFAGYGELRQICIMPSREIRGVNDSRSRGGRSSRSRPPKKNNRERRMANEGEYGMNLGIVDEQGEGHVDRGMGSSGVSVDAGGQVNGPEDDFGIGRLALVDSGAAVDRENSGDTSKGNHTEVVADDKTDTKNGKE